VIFLPVNQMKI